MIVGQPGSGKSTLARRIGDLTGLPVVHIDQIHWTPGWVERTRDEKTRLCREAHAREAWVFEGGHSQTWPERLDRCDTLIWLDFPFHVRMARVLRRSLRHRGRTRPDMPEGCPERISWSFYRWIWDTRRSGRLQIEGLVSAAPSDKAVLVFRRVAQVKAFLRDLPS